MNEGTMDRILEKNGRDPAALLAILQDVQTEENWLPPEALSQISAGLGIPLARVYRLATFFKSLSLKPRGKHICQVCIGTTCHVRGAPRLVDKVELEMGVKAGETTKDMEFTVETVGCVGACALGPVVVLDKQYHGGMTAEKLGKVLRKIKGQPADAAAEEA